MQSFLALLRKWNEDTVSETRIHEDFEPYRRKLFVCCGRFYGTRNKVGLVPLNGHLNGPVGPAFVY